jgi:hypothetical protein
VKFFWSILMLVAGMVNQKIEGGTKNEGGE